MIHNYETPYGKSNIFVVYTHLGIKFDMATPEIILNAKVLNILRYVTFYSVYAEIYLDLFTMSVFFHYYTVRHKTHQNALAHYFLKH